jgi:MGT family glycosyltransferase
VPAELDAPTEPPVAALDHYGFLVPEPSAPPAPMPYPAGDGPRVLVGLSTTYLGQEELLTTIVGALGRLDVRAIVTTGPSVDPGSVDAPASVRVVGWIDHASVLADTDLMVTHAGLASVAGALQAGVPLVCTPISRDQPLNAARVEHVGAGITVAGDASTVDLARAIERTASDPDVRRAARALSAASRAAGGATAAAAALVDLAGTG